MIEMLWLTSDDDDGDDGTAAWGFEDGGQSHEYQIYHYLFTT